MNSKVRSQNSISDHNNGIGESEVSKSAKSEEKVQIEQFEPHKSTPTNKSHKSNKSDINDEHKNFSIEDAKDFENYEAAKEQIQPKVRVKQEQKKRINREDRMTNEDYLQSVLDQSSKVISLFRRKQSSIALSRSSLIPKPAKSYRRSPERIGEVEKVVSPVSSSSKHKRQYNYKQSDINKEADNITKKIKTSPSLLQSRRKLSPTREVARDDFIDTADLVLNKEIKMINSLMQLKLKKEREILQIKVEIDDEKLKTERIAGE